MTKTMTPAAWIFMGAAWTAIITLVVFCYHRMFSIKRGQGAGEDKR